MNDKTEYKTVKVLGIKKWEIYGREKSDLFSLKQNEWKYVSSFEDNGDPSESFQSMLDAHMVIGNE